MTKEKPDILIYIDNLTCRIKINGEINVAQLSIVMATLMTETLTTIQEARKLKACEPIAKGNHFYQ